MKVFVIYAHPEPNSITRQLVQVSINELTRQGHEIVQSDLYGMRWKAVFDEDDFPSRLNPERLSFIAESGHAYKTGTQTEDVSAEQAKLLSADAVIFHFPFWWFGVPAILKGWIERVFAYGFGYGYKGQGNRYRYGDGILKGKRALVSTVVGAPAVDYGPRGINGPVDQLLFPLTHGAFFFAGMDVLPIHAVYGAGFITTEDQVDIVKQEWRSRLAGLFDDAPIRFRPQNDGDYPDYHTLAENIAPSESGLLVHIAKRGSG